MDPPRRAGDASRPPVGANEPSTEGPDARVMTSTRPLSFGPFNDLPMSGWRRRVRRPGARGRSETLHLVAASASNPAPIRCPRLPASRLATRCRRGAECHDRSDVSAARNALLTRFDRSLAAPSCVAAYRRLTRSEPASRHQRTAHRPFHRVQFRDPQFRPAKPPERHTGAATFRLKAWTFRTRGRRCCTPRLPLSAVPIVRQRRFLCGAMDHCWSSGDGCRGRPHVGTLRVNGADNSRSRSGQDREPLGVRPGISLA
ncbi:hypothetical protein AWB75_06273 [Caballeronia catudaia]|uniref:Uncharacterized protein n=1 Tax=Caballeronia catudaia TaxID=1777136 RepID=A0A158D637_9BURK|nr:hypothetical protein AWB75_06273 [Caballeronia catudaia]